MVAESNNKLVMLKCYFTVSLYFTTIKQCGEINCSSQYDPEAES